MLDELKEQVFLANQELKAQKLVIYTWGNVSGVSEDGCYMAIKPSGVRYEDMSAADMVVLEVASGEVAEGRLRPSSDTATHLALYRAFPELGGITHTHSLHAVAFAQAGLAVRPLGTTHADHFFGPVPCTRELTREEVAADYEANTGRAIVDAVRGSGKSPMDVPGVLVRSHGPFTWGKDAAESVYHAKVLEMVCEMELKTLMLNPSAEMPGYLLDKHYERKHGAGAYYGQGYTGVPNYPYLG